MSETPPYANAPLVLAVVEVRHPETSALTTRDQQRLKARLKELLPLQATERQHDFSVMLPPQGVPAVQAAGRDLLKFSTRSKRTTVTYSSQAVIVETTDYRGWTHLRRYVESAVAARQAEAPADGLVRIGIRMIDEIRVAEATPNWADWVSGQLLPPRATYEGVELQVDQQQSVIQYRGLQRGDTLTVRYGAMNGVPAVQSAPNLVRPSLPLPGRFFLLDTDSAWTLNDGEETPLLTVPGVIEIGDRLHHPMRDLFEQFITSRLREEVLK